MTPNENDSFSTLTILLLQQYQELDRIINRMCQGSDLAVDGIAVQMKAIKNTESSLSSLRRAFLDAGNQLNSDLQAATDQTISIVKELMPKLAQLEKATCESAKRLLPDVQESVRAVQMQNAYGIRRRT